MALLDNPSPPTTRVHVILALVAIGMFGFAFALVPLYDTLCRALCINGKIEASDEHRPPGAVSTAGEVRVELVASGAEQAGWQFYPLVRTVNARPGRIYTVRFHARNASGRRMTVRAVPSVTPGEAVRYLVKTDCFCFEEQALDAGESLKMPLSFYVDGSIPEKYRTLTLSYTLLDAERQ